VIAAGYLIIVNRLLASAIFLVRGPVLPTRDNALPFFVVFSVVAAQAR